MRFADSEQISLLLGRLGRHYEVYVPRRRGDSLVLARLDATTGTTEFDWNDYRLAEPLKPLWFQPAGVLAGWLSEVPTGAPSQQPRAIVGAKACDLVALRAVDRVFRVSPHRQPAYSLAREQNVIISGDCTGHGESCFCTMVGDLPFPADLFDLNLSPCAGGYLVEVGSERGQRILDEHARLFREARAEEVEARSRNRQEVTRRVRDQNARFQVKDAFAVSILKNVKTRIWGELAASCVECNACNYICPTCHCFLLHDCRVEKNALRFGLWDSCFHAGYARMAGGGTPRLQLTERFKNHFFHKFVAFPDNWGLVACTGCGRCIDACLGRIDKRDCLHQLEARWIPSEVVEGM